MKGAFQGIEVLDMAYVYPLALPCLPTRKVVKPLGSLLNNLVELLDRVVFGIRLLHSLRLLSIARVLEDLVHRSLERLGLDGFALVEDGNAVVLRYRADLGLVREFANEHHGHAVADCVLYCAVACTGDEDVDLVCF